VTAIATISHPLPRAAAAASGVPACLGERRGRWPTQWVVVTMVLICGERVCGAVDARGVTRAASWRTGGAHMAVNNLDPALEG
jgi:hypothetical protein